MCLTQQVVEVKIDSKWNHDHCYKTQSNFGRALTFKNDN